MFAQPYQFRFIYRGENPSRAYRVRPAASVLPQTFRRVAGKKLLKFLRESHGKTMPMKRAILKERLPQFSLFCLALKAPTHESLGQRPRTLDCIANQR